MLTCTLFRPVWVAGRRTCMGLMSEGAVRGLAPATARVVFPCGKPTGLASLASDRSPSDRPTPTLRLQHSRSDSPFHAHVAGSPRSSGLLRIPCPGAATNVALSV